MKMFANIILVLASCASSSKMETALEKVAASSELPSVPEVRNPDKNGFPMMRPIESVMEGWKHERDYLNHEAAVLGLHLKKLEKDDADRIAQQDGVYLAKLKEQEKTNQVVAVENAKVAKLVMEVRKGNDKLSTLVQKEQKVIKLRRKQFADLKRQFLEGSDRVNDLLKGNDLVKGKDPSTEMTAEMALLQMGDEARRKENEPEDEEEKLPTSFLEIPQLGSDRKTTQTHKHEQVSNAALSKPDATNPQQSTEMTSSELEAAAGFDDPAQEPVVEVATQSFSHDQTGLTELERETGTQISGLAEHASTLDKAAHRSLADLKLSFDEADKAGKARLSALVLQQNALKASLKSSEKQFAELKATYKRVTGLRQSLEQELHKNGALLGEVQKME